MEITEILLGQVLWEKCFGKQLCVKIPFDGKKCFSARGCVRLIKDGGKYLIEIELFGRRVRYNLVKQCYPAFRVGIASVEVCADPAFRNGSLTGVTISAKLCIGVKIGPVKANKCWTVIRTTIRFFALDEITTSMSEKQLLRDEFIRSALEAEAEYMIIEEEDDEDEDLATGSASESAVVVCGCMENSSESD